MGVLAVLNCYTYMKSLHYEVDIYMKDIDNKFQHVLCDSFLGLAQIETLAYKVGSYTITIYDEA